MYVCVCVFGIRTRQVVTDEEQLRQMSLEAEPPAGGAAGLAGLASHHAAATTTSSGGSESKATGTVLRQ